VSDLAGLQLLLKPDQPVDLVIDAIDLTLAFSSCEAGLQIAFFRSSTDLSDTSQTPTFSGSF
jgi:hypothetical protein